MFAPAIPFFPSTTYWKNIQHRHRNIRQDRPTPSRQRSQSGQTRLRICPASALLHPLVCSASRPPFCLHPPVPVVVLHTLHALVQFLFVQPPDCFFLFASYLVQLFGNVSCVSSSSVMFRVTQDSLFSSIYSFSLFACRNSATHPLLPGGRIRPKSL
jgi:hypothetical protein